MRKFPPLILEVRNQMAQCLQARGKKYYANLITSAFYLSVAADSGDKVPEGCLEVIL